MKQIPLSQGQVAIVDDADYESLGRHKWSYDGRRNGGYARRQDGRRWIRMHRVIAGAAVGVQVNHRDGDGLNNQRANLRLATNAQNVCNRGLQSNNTSGYKGVSWSTHKLRWVAVIHHEGRRKCLGYFVDKLTAAKAYDAAARLLHGEFARCNLPWHTPRAT